MLLALIALFLSILQLGTIMRNPIFFRSMAVSSCAVHVHSIAPPK